MHLSKILKNSSIITTVLDSHFPRKTVKTKGALTSLHSKPKENETQHSKTKTTKATTTSSRHDAVSRRYCSLLNKKITLFMRPYPTTQ